MIDCHAHLTDSKFKNDIDDVIGRAKTAGILKTVVVPEFASEFQKVIDLHERYPDFIVPCAGLHPIHKNRKGVKLDQIPVLEAFLSRHEGVIKCIGEIGLDYTVKQFKIDEESMKVMRDVMREEIRIAHQFDLPLNVHSRSAPEDTLSLLSECEASRVLMHAFGGTPDQARKGVQCGYYFSIPPSYGIDDARADLVSAIPLSNLLLETDSPVLGPVRGERNEPMNVRYSAEFIARVKNISVEEVIRQTTENARNLFRI